MTLPRLQPRRVHLFGHRVANAARLSRSFSFSWTPPMRLTLLTAAFLSTPPLATASAPALAQEAAQLATAGRSIRLPSGCSGKVHQRNDRNRTGRRGEPASWPN